MLNFSSVSLDPIMSPPDKLQHLWLDNSNTGQKLSSQVPPNLSEIEMIFTVLSSDLSKKWLTSLKKNKISMHISENGFCSGTSTLFLSELGILQTHSESTSVALNCKKCLIHNDLYFLRSLCGKNPFPYSKEKQKNPICLMFPGKSWCWTDQANTSKTILMYVKLGTTNLSHLRKFKPILVQLRNSKHFENTKELNHMSCLR